MKILPALFALVSLVPLAGARPQAPTADQIDRASERSVRFLRAAQQEDGSYGDVSATAATLIAFGEHRRSYRPDDGPFVERALAWLRAAQAEDGSVAAAGADAAGKRLQTTSALHAFQVMGAHDAAAQAIRFLGVQELSLVGSPRRLAEGLPTDALLDQAATILARQRADGSIGDVAETASATTELIGIQAALAGRETPATPAKAEPLPAFGAADAAQALAAALRGGAFLVQAEVAPGRWGVQGPDAGITAMVAGGLASLPAPRSETVQRSLESALDWLVSLQKPDGSIHDGALANYVTGASVLALVAGARPEDAPVVARARAYLLALQSDEGEGYGPSHRYYGGVGYGDDERPDLSNLQMALEALSAAGVPSDDAAFQRALVFLQRCQNRSESNDLEMTKDGETIVGGDDGGAAYAPGDSKAGYVTLANGKKVPRSYGSMTYALLKGYMLAGLSKDDPRVEAAWKWLREHYTLDVNPGFEASSNPTAGYQGLFYYFLSMARALALYGEDEVTDAAGAKHAWRSELCGRLVAMQRRDGSWKNDNSARWFEGNPVLATAYALVTLRTARPEDGG